MFGEVPLLWVACELISPKWAEWRILDSLEHRSRYVLSSSGVETYDRLGLLP